MATKKICDRCGFAWEEGSSTDDSKKVLHVSVEGRYRYWAEGSGEAIVQPTTRDLCTDCYDIVLEVMNEKISKEP